MSDLRRIDRPAAAAPFQPVRTAQEQVADQLRGLIVSGRLRPGERLPPELELARELAVSRPTVREALRSLSAQNLIRTVKGPTGGSFVTLPTVDHISEFMRSSLALLAESESVTLEHLLQARELVEVPAARLAAELRRPEALERLAETVPDDALELPLEHQFTLNTEFHAAVVDACGNVLLSIALQPIFSVLRTHLQRSALPAGFHRAMHDQHREIGALIAAGDPDAAAEAMQQHLDYLRPSYERAWKETFPRRAAAR